MSQLKNGNISPVRFIRKMRGSSQSSLIEASDGNLYIVKLQHDFIGSQIVFNEAIGSELYRQIGLPTPDWSGIEIGDQFIDSNRGLWCESHGKVIRPHSGLHFASQYLGDETHSVYEVLPGSWYSRIQNRSDFLGALVADVWFEHVDSRQALFLQKEGEHSLAAVFIDHGHLLGGPEGGESMRLRACFHLDMRIYNELDVVSNMEYWLDRFRRNGDVYIANAVTCIPKEWIKPNYLRKIDRLLSNLTRLHEQIFPDAFRWIQTPGNKKVVVQTQKYKAIVA